MKNKLIGIGLAVALFITGAVVGAVIDRSWVRKGPAAEKTTPGKAGRVGKRHARMIKRFRKRLNLTDEQTAAVSKILTESRQRMRGDRKKAREDIRKLLNPEQLKKYERMLERRQKRRRNRRGRRGRRGR